jgi:protein-tyrosine phosphatase
MVRILNQIDMCIKYDKPVYVHCWGGKGRTGTVIGYRTLEIDHLLVQRYCPNDKT